jgi:hypothetical protein
MHRRRKVSVSNDHWCNRLKSYKFIATVPQRVCSIESRCHRANLATHSSVINRRADQKQMLQDAEVSRRRVASSAIPLWVRCAIQWPSLGCSPQGRCRDNPWPGPGRSEESQPGRHWIWCMVRRKRVVIPPCTRCRVSGAIMAGQSAQ